MAADKPTKGESAESRNGESEKSGSQDLKQLQDLYELMLQEGLDSLELKDDDSRVRLTRRSAPVPAHSVQYGVPQVAHSAPDSPTPPAEEISANQDGITTPLAGVFYRASSPTSAPFVKEGDSVQLGQTLCIIEAMKVMNEIKAESNCKILRIVAENSRPVTAGQVLFQVEPA